MLLAFRFGKGTTLAFVMAAGLLPIHPACRLSCPTCVNVFLQLLQLELTDYASVIVPVDIQPLLRWLCSYLLRKDIPPTSACLF